MVSRVGANATQYRGVGGVQYRRSLLAGDRMCNGFTERRRVMEVCASYNLFLPKAAFWDVGAYIHIID